EAAHGVRRRGAEAGGDQSGRERGVTHVPWFGTLHVRPKPGVVGVIPADMVGGYVNVLALAASDREFRDRAIRRFDLEGFDVLEVEEASPVADLNTLLDEPSRDALDRLSEASPVECGAFFGYSNEDA
ncbi:MAG: hypothetical protein KJ954_05475, partial [Alphaproteobacteria bacterium]|nr:hypothetical protein [Alphaproteobacteria bacterium]